MIPYTTVTHSAFAMTGTASSYRTDTAQMSLTLVNLKKLKWKWKSFRWSAWPLTVSSSCLIFGASKANELLLIAKRFFFELSQRNGSLKNKRHVYLPAVLLPKLHEAKCDARRTLHEAKSFGSPERLCFMQRVEKTRRDWDSNELPVVLTFTA